MTLIVLAKAHKYLEKKVILDVQPRKPVIELGSL
jgi:hypothetical protein